MLLEERIGMNCLYGCVVLGTCLSIPSPLLKEPGLRARDIVVRHQEKRSGAWCISSTPNFHIYHDGSYQLAERVALTAERARANLANRWLGEEDADWQVPCRIFLHADRDGFVRATGQPAATPGYSFTGAEGDRVVSRRIDLRSDHPRMLTSVVPHEVTHILLAYRFGAALRPWANEGMAVLGEPDERVARHLQDLPRYHREGLLWSCRQLMDMADYPATQLYGPFYAQSVSLVDFLVRHKNASTFTRFLRDSERDGCEKALKAHYGWSYKELEQHWKKHALGSQR
jgi:hypothetical protein